MLRGSLGQLLDLGPAAAVGKSVNGMRLSSQTLEATHTNSFWAPSLLTGNVQDVGIVLQMYSSVLLTPRILGANYVMFQAISLPSVSGGDRGGTVFPFGLSANEDGGPHKQSSLACLRNTNR